MIHFDINFIERFLGTKVTPNPMKRQNMQENRDYCQECRREWEEAKQYNRQPVIISLDKESPLRREYPLIIPSIRKK